MRKRRRLSIPLRRSSNLPESAGRSPEANGGDAAMGRRGHSRSILTADQDRCDGCGECVIACEAARGPASAASGPCIAVISLQDDRLWLPMFCQQCRDAPCASTCPTGALSRDHDMAMVKLDQRRCVGCGICLMSCPFGAIHLDPKVNKTSKCDLCGGDPACVKKCQARALVFGASYNLGKGRRRAVGAKVACVIAGWR